MIPHLPSFLLRSLSTSVCLLLVACAAPVDPEPILEVVIIAPAGVVVVGGTLQLESVARTAVGPVADAPAAWKSSAPAIADVDENGLVRGVSPGEAIISATVRGTAGELPVRVEDGEVLEVRIVAPVTFVGVDTILQLSHESRTAAGTPAVSPPHWQSSAPAIAQVDQTGRVRGLSLGEVVITATLGGRQDEITIRVVEQLHVLLGRRTELYEAVAIGASRPLRLAIHRPGSGALVDRPVSWSSSDPAVVAVDQRGVITGVSRGEAIVTAVPEGAPHSSLRIVVETGFEIQQRFQFTAQRLNARGEVVGYRVNARGGPRAVLWSDGQERVIGPTMASSPRLVLNDRGQVAGTYHATFDPIDRVYRDPRAFFWDGETSIDIPIPEQATLFVITALREDGTVFGYWEEAGTPTRGDAFSWRAGKLTSLGSFGGDRARLADVNRRGDLLITVWPQHRTFIVGNGGVIDLGDGEGVSISDGADAVITRGGSDRVRWNGEFHEFAGGRHSFYMMMRISTAGVLVGSFANPAPGAVVWMRGALFVLSDLVGHPGVQSSVAIDINEDGQLLLPDALLRSLK